MSLVTAVPDALTFRGIASPLQARGFVITLDEAQPQGGGRIAGRVERVDRRRDPRLVRVDVRCHAAWMDIAPQLVGREPLTSWTTVAEIRNRHVPIWLEEEVYRASLNVGALEDDNWRPFSFDLPEGLPRAMEGTFVAFRWRIEARRPRRLGIEQVSLPLILVESQDLPVVRVEASPIGTWRLLEWRHEDEVDGAAGPCSVAFQARRPGDLPLPGETRSAELARRSFI